MTAQLDSASYKPTPWKEVSRMFRVTMFWSPTFLPNVYIMLAQTI